MQKSNNTKYILVSALLVFASVKKGYAESEITEENNLASLEEISLLTQKPSEESSHETRQKELLKELLTQTTQEENSSFENNSENTVSPEESSESPEALTSEQLFNTLVNSLSPEEQVQFIELLEEATIASEINTDKIDVQALENSNTSLFAKFNVLRCIGFGIKVALAIVCWEIIQPLIEKKPKETIAESKPNQADTSTGDSQQNATIASKSFECNLLSKASLEIFKVLTGVLLVDDIKDFLKEFKKATEAECQSLYSAFFPSTQQS